MQSYPLNRVKLLQLHEAEREILVSGQLIEVGYTTDQIHPMGHYDHRVPSLDV